MNKCCLTNCNRGIGTISKKQDIKTIYHGDLQNGYDKGDLFDANAVIDQIKKYGGESGGDSSDKKILELQLNFQYFPSNYFEYIDGSQGCVRFRQYFSTNGVNIVNRDQFNTIEDLYNVDTIIISVINIPDDYQNLKQIFPTNNKFTFNVSYKTLADDKKFFVFIISDSISDNVHIKLCVSEIFGNYDYLDFEYIHANIPTANKNLVYDISNPEVIFSNVLDFNKYYKIYDSGASGASFIGVPQLANMFWSNNVEDFQYGTASIKIGSSFAKALVTVKTGMYKHLFQITLDFIIPILDSRYSNKFEGCRARIKLSVTGENYSKTDEQMIIYSNTSSSADLNWNEL